MKLVSTETIDDERFSFEVFRQAVSNGAMSAAALNLAWPIPRFVSAFKRFDNLFGIHMGAVPLDDLQKVLLQTGIKINPLEHSTMIDFLDNYVYFEDFLDAMKLVHNEYAESRYTKRLEERKHRTGRTLQFLVNNTLATLLMTFGLLIGELLKFLLNLFVLARANSEDIGQLTIDLGSYVEALRHCMDNMPLLLQMIGG